MDGNKNNSVEKKISEEKTNLDKNYNSVEFGLSQEFFETILDYETNLKEKFDPKIFFELINLYSTAIKYYERLNNKKFIIYNQALNYLFELPETKKFMEGKDLAKIFRKKEIISKFKKCEEIVTEKKVKLFIDKRLNEEKILNSINHLYNNDINKQKNNLDKIIQEKREKYKNKKMLKEEEKNQIEIKKNDDINKINEIKEEKFEDEFKIGEDDDLMNIDIGENEQMQEDENDIKFSVDDVAELINIAKEEKNNEDDNKDIDSNEEMIINNKIDLKQSIKLTNKSRFSEKLDNNFDIYFISYYEYFINNNIDLIINDIQEKSEKEIKEVSKSDVDLFNQIKDMEYLLNDENTDENYKKEIQKIIGELKGKQNKNLINMINGFEIYSKKLDKKYIINNTLFKEKFKLDMTKLLNTFIFK
jgi:hypothetical protein